MNTFFSLISSLFLICGSIFAFYNVLIKIELKKHNYPVTFMYTSLSDFKEFSKLVNKLEPGTLRNDYKEMYKLGSIFGYISLSLLLLLIISAILYLN
jgi:hypothetical protein